MSKRINVNPEHYKVAGRERPGDDVPPPERAPGGLRNRGEQERWERKQKQQQDSKDR